LRAHIERPDLTMTDVEPTPQGKVNGMLGNSHQGHVDHISIQDESKVGWHGKLFLKLRQPDN